MVEQEQEGCVLGLAAHGVDTGRDLGRRTHSGPLTRPLEEGVHVALFRPGAEVVGCPLTIDVTRYRWSARVEATSIGGQRLCALEMDKVCPQITRIAACSVETV